MGETAQATGLHSSPTPSRSMRRCRRSTPRKRGGRSSGLNEYVCDSKRGMGRGVSCCSLVSISLLLLGLSVGFALIVFHTAVSGRWLRLTLQFDQYRQARLTDDVSVPLWIDTRSPHVCFPSTYNMTLHLHEPSRLTEPVHWNTRTDLLPLRAIVANQRVEMSLSHRNLKHEPP